jgi:hypothetical protein
MTRFSKVKSNYAILAFVCGLLMFLPKLAKADDFTQWHYYADATVVAQADETYDSVYADFTHLLKSTFHTSGVLDENSIRVVPLQNGAPGAPVDFRFVKAADYDAAANAAGTLVFQVTATANPTDAQYRIYFDTKSNGAKPAFANSADVPQTANMIWNSGFEILSQDYKGENKYANAGANMPRGWWGNMRNSGIADNLATSVHSGQHALGFVTPADAKHVAISTAPSPPGLRVAPGQNYVFSFWVKGEQLTSANPLTASIYWYDKTGKFLSRASFNTAAGQTGSFDWTYNEAILQAPGDAYFGTMYIGTYSSTGLLTVDDVNAHIAVPPLLQ